MRSLCPKQDFTADYSHTRTLEPIYVLGTNKVKKASHASRVYSFLIARQSLKIDDIDLHTTYSK